MAKPLGDALPGLRIQLAVHNPASGHRRQLTCHRAVIICRTLMPQSMRNDAEVRISANVTDDFGNVTGLSGRC